MTARHRWDTLTALVALMDKLLKERRVDWYVKWDTLTLMGHQSNGTDMTNYLLIMFRRLMVFNLNQWSRNSSKVNKNLFSSDWSAMVGISCIQAMTSGSLDNKCSAEQSSSIIAKCHNIFDYRWRFKIVSIIHIARLTPFRTRPKCFLDSEDARYIHDDVIKWKHFPRYWPFVRGIHRWPVNSPHHKGQWRGVLMLSLIYV